MVCKLHKVSEKLASTLGCSTPGVVSKEPHPLEFPKPIRKSGFRFAPETGASLLFAEPEMGSVLARTPRGTRTSAMTGRRVAWPGLSSPPVLTRRTPTKRSALRLRGGCRTPLVAYAPSLSYAPPRSVL